MNKKKKIKLLIIELILLVAAICGVLIWLSSQHKQETIYAYARSIEYNDNSNYALKSSDIVETQILAADMKDTYVQNADELIGRYITTTVYKGDYVSKKQLTKDPKKIDKNAFSDLAGNRKIYFDINFRTGFAGDIEAGDIVDLVAVYTGSGLSTEKTASVAGAGGSVTFGQAKIFMQGIPVYQVYKNGAVYKKQITDPATLGKFQGENSMSGDESTQTNDVGAPDQVALTVTAEQYEEILARQAMGYTISLVSRFDESQDVNTNGYVVISNDGRTANIYAGQGNLEEDHGIVTNAETTDSNAQPAEIQLPPLYSFIKTLAKISMTEDQRQRYTSVYTRYSEFMTKTQGTEWEINNPDSVTMEALQNSIDANNQDEVNAFMTFKGDLETLAKELKGNSVLLPW